MIKLTAVTGDIATSDADAIVVNLFDGVTSPSGATGAVDRALDGAISALIADKEIKGKQSQISMIHTLGKLPTKRVIVLGLGRREKFSVNVVRDVSGAVARYLRRIGVSRAATIAHGAGTEKRFLRAFPMHGFTPWVDTLQIARKCLPKITDYSLGALLQKLNLEGEVADKCPGLGWHDALFDAVASLVLLRRMLQEKSASNDPYAILGLN